MRFVDVDTPTPVSVIGLGTWQFGSKEWGYGADYDERESAAIVRRALELGVTLFDTAEIYGMGRSERILGAALRAADADLDHVFLATKIMPVLPVASVVEQRAVASARRLGVRRIDLYQVHQPNPVVTDPTTMRGMHSLQQLGLVRHIGVSNYSLGRWEAADRALAAAQAAAETDLADAVPSATVVLSNQVQYSLMHRRPESDVIPFAAGNRRMVIAYSPLAQGVLSARFGPHDRPSGGIRSLNPLFLPENLAAASELLGVLRDIAATHQVTPAQIALAWVIRHPQVAAIPGASSLAQLESNVAAAEIVLTPDQVAALGAAAGRFSPVTGRKAIPALLRARRSR